MLRDGNVLVGLVWPESLDLPFTALVGVPVLTFGEVGSNGPRAILDGRNTAAQRSYSRQSKYDFARRYFCTS